MKMKKKAMVALLAVILAAALLGSILAVEEPQRGDGIVGEREVGAGKAKYLIFDGNNWLRFDASERLLPLPTGITQEEINSGAMELWGEGESIREGYTLVKRNNAFIIWLEAVDAETEVGEASPAGSPPIRDSSPPPSAEPTVISQEERGTTTILTLNNGETIYRNSEAFKGFEFRRDGDTWVAREVDNPAEWQPVSPDKSPKVKLLFSLPDNVDVFFDQNKELRYEPAPGYYFLNPKEPNDYQVASISSTMGEAQYGQFKSQLDLSRITVTREGGHTQTTFNLKGIQGGIRVRNQLGVSIVEVIRNEPLSPGEVQAGQPPYRFDRGKSEIITLFREEEIARQGWTERDQGIAHLGGAGSPPVFLGPEFAGENNKDRLAQRLREGKTLPFYANAEAQRQKLPPIGFAQLDAQSSVFTSVNLEQRTQTRINALTGVREESSGDAYRKGQGGCTNDAGCFVPNEGVVTLANGQQLAADYDYEGTGADRKFEEANLYEGGQLVGRISSDHTLTRLIRDENGQYGSLAEIQTADGQKIIARRGDDGGWVAVSGALVVGQQREGLENLRSRFVGFRAQFREAVQNIYRITQDVRDYPALARLLGAEESPLEKWLGDSDKVFAPMLGRNWFPSAICEAGLDYDIDVEGVATLRTPTGVDQPVAHIEMERSEQKSPVLCSRNPNPEAEQEFICDPGQACADSEFCFPDANFDGQPDAERFVEGYFYKITWGVTAPRDEVLTPLIDENGVGVSFNIYLDQFDDGKINDGAIPLYSREGNVRNPIQLRNGQGDQGVIVKYSPNLYGEVCIGWHQAPETSQGRFSGTRRLGDVCFSADVSELGQVKWGRSGRPAGSTRVSAGEVTQNTNW